LPFAAGTILEYRQQQHMLGFKSAQNFIRYSMLRDEMLKQGWDGGGESN